METQDPSLPPNPELLNRQPKWFKPVLKGTILITIVFWFFALFIPYPGGHRKKAAPLEAKSNALQIGLSLFEFDQEYGSYPNNTTTTLVTSKHPTHGFDLSGTSSNATFRQLLAANISPSEEIFYANIKGSKKPDGDISPGEAAKKGEVGFAYISGLSSKDDPKTPLVIAPIIPGTTKFDPKPFDGKAIILRIDQSVSSLKLRDGHAIMDGEDVLSPKHPIWNGKAPDIRYPE